MVSRHWVKGQADGWGAGVPVALDDETAIAAALQVVCPEPSVVPVEGGLLPTRPICRF